MCLVCLGALCSEHNAWARFTLPVQKEPKQMPGTQRLCLVHIASAARAIADAWYTMLGTQCLCLVHNPSAARFRADAWNTVPVQRESKQMPGTLCLVHNACAWCSMLGTRCLCSKSQSRRLVYSAYTAGVEADGYLQNAWFGPQRLCLVHNACAARARAQRASKRTAEMGAPLKAGPLATGHRMRAKRAKTVAGAPL